MNCPRCDLVVRRLLFDRAGNSRCQSCVAKENYDTNPAVAVHVDSIPGGIVVENYGPNPIRFDS